MTLHEKGQPGHNLLVELRDGSNPSVVLADNGRVLIGIEIEGIGDVDRVVQQGAAGLEIGQPNSRGGVDLPEGRQAL